MKSRFVLAASVLALCGTVAAQGVQAYAQTVERKCSRIAYFGANGSPGQFNVQYGQPVWRDEHNAQMEAMKGERARFGDNFWTTLDTSMDLTIGGIKVPAGYYYLALGRTEKGDWQLVLFDPAALRPYRPDAFVTDKLSKFPAIEVPLDYAMIKGGEPVEKLSVELTAKKGKDLGHANLEIAWGPHRLAAAIVANMDSPPRKAPPAQPAEASAKKGKKQGDR